MKNFGKILLLSAICLVALALVGCGGSQDEALVGTWDFPEIPGWSYTFNEDGSGQRGMPGFGVETFNWSTSGTQLRINLDNAPAGYTANERWDYEISGNRLTITSRQTDGLTFSYTRR